MTKRNRKIVVNLAINYGAKMRLLEHLKIKKKFTLKNFEKSLYTKLPNPDILIRTGGQKRLSNMLWQLAYTELFLNKLWPEFNSDLKKLLENIKLLKETLWFMISINLKKE